MIKTARIFLMVSLFFMVFAGILPAENSARPDAVIAAEKVAGNVVETEAEKTVETGGPVQSQTQSPPVQLFPGESFQFSLLRVIGGLGLVLCLMIVLVFAGKKFFPNYFRKTVSEKNLKILETLSMGEHRSIALVQVAGTRFLVGNTPNQINLLTRIPESASLISDSTAMPSSSADTDAEDNKKNFRRLYEVEKKRSTTGSGNPLPEDVRAKMRLLREALER